MHNRLFSFATLLVLFAQPAHAAELTLSDVAEAGRLIVTAWQADIELAASGDNNVRVEYECAENATPGTGAESDGLRIVGGGDFMPELRRNDEKITLMVGKRAGTCRLHIKAPARIDAELRVNRAGNVRAESWLGSLAAWVAEGDVNVTGQSGPFSVTAMSGNASVEFTGEVLRAESAVTAANGLLTLVLTDEPGLNLRAQARWGVIRSDLDADFANRTDGGQSWSIAKLAGGGATITLRNLNSDIVIRRAADN